MSYANVIMYGATLPNYSNSEEKEERFNADDPSNNEKMLRAFAKLNN